jgi:hypothetical protein
VNISQASTPYAPIGEPAGTRKKQLKQHPGREPVALDGPGHKGDKYAIGVSGPGGAHVALKILERDRAAGSLARRTQAASRCTIGGESSPLAFEQVEDRRHRADLPS